MSRDEVKAKRRPASADERDDRHEQSNSKRRYPLCVTIPWLVFTEVIIYGRDIRMVVLLMLGAAQRGDVTRRVPEMRAVRSLSVKCHMIVWRSRSISIKGSQSNSNYFRHRLPTGRSSSPLWKSYVVLAAGSGELTMLDSHRLLTPLRCVLFIDLIRFLSASTPITPSLT